MKDKKEELKAELTRLNALRKQVKEKLKAFSNIWDKDIKSKIKNK